MKQLATANRTTLNVTAKNVILTFDYSAIMTRLPVCSPIFRLFAIPNALPLNTAD